MRAICIICLSLVFTGCSAELTEGLIDVCSEAQPRQFLNAYHDCLHEELGDVSDVCVASCPFGGQYFSHGDYLFCELNSGEFAVQAICVPREEALP